jgi:hypothetical protein
VTFVRFFTLIALSFCSLSLAHADERVLVRSQWRTSNINEPNITFFEHRNDHTLHIEGGINLKENEIRSTSDPSGCVNFLSKLTEYPLKKMLDRNFLTREQYEFYKKFAGNLQPEQVVFYNVAIPKVQHFEIKYISMNPHDPFLLEDQISKTLMENLVPFGRKNAQLTDEELVQETSKMLETQASMWLVRNFVEEAPGKLTMKHLPWQVEKNFADVPAHSKDGLLFELGRVATEKPEDAQTLFRSAILTAANDVLITGKKLSESKVYAHAISPIHIRYYKTFGFNPVKTLENGESLMEVNLEQLFRQLNPVKDFHESAPYLAFFNDDPVKALQFRNKIRTSRTQMIEPIDGSGKKPLVLSYHTDWHAFAAEEFSHFTDAQRSAFIYNSSSTPDIFAHDHIPAHFLQSRTPGNHIYGLDPAELAKDPHYIGKTIGGIYLHSVNELNKGGQYTLYFGQKLVHESPMVFTSTDPTIIAQAKRMGATATPISETYRTRKLSENKVSHIVSEGVELSFSNEQVKQISAIYFHNHMIPDLSYGKFHQQYLRMNGL